MQAAAAEQRAVVAEQAVAIEQAAESASAMELALAERGVLAIEQPERVAVELVVELEILVVELAAAELK